MSKNIFAIHHVSTPSVEKNYNHLMALMLHVCWKIFISKTPDQTRPFRRNIELFGQLKNAKIRSILPPKTEPYKTLIVPGWSPEPFL